MITTELFFGLVISYLIMSMTLGPNHVKLRLSEIKFGFKKIIFILI